MRLKPWIPFVIIVVILTAIYASVVLCTMAEAGLPRMESLTATYTADGDCIKAYVLRDPGTGIEYLVTDHGGITERVKN